MSESNYWKERFGVGSIEEQVVRLNACIEMFRDAKLFFKNRINSLKLIMDEKDSDTLHYATMIDHAESEIRRIENEIRLSEETLTDENGWKPIICAPKDGTHILVQTRAHGINVLFYEDDEWRSGAGFVFGQVTHWQPLPKSPEGYFL